jgi:dCTP deaminase
MTEPEVTDNQTPAGETLAPGVMSDHQLRTLMGEGGIASETDWDSEQVQPASLDLRLAADVYRIRASFLPGRDRSVGRHLGGGGLHMHRIDISEGAVLETGCVYLALLQERLKLPANVSGRANPKSSTGRIDVFTRLVTDRAETFDTVAPGYDGPLFLEICPRTYSILARKGDRLAQLRLRSGPQEAVKELIFRVDLSGEPGQPVGWRARRHAGIVDLRKVGGHAVAEYWEPVYTHKGRVVLHPDEFYILASKESVKVPTTQAAEMAPIAPELGEFRAHYAGFFDPGFGTNQGGSKAVLEVRSRDVPFILEDGQPVGKLVYERLSAKPARTYGQSGNNYQGQALRLSKHFAP